MSLVNILIELLNSQPHIFKLSDRHSTYKIDQAVNILRTELAQLLIDNDLPQGNNKDAKVNDLKVDGTKIMVSATLRHHQIWDVLGVKVTTYDITTPMRFWVDPINMLVGGDLCVDLPPSIGGKVCITLNQILELIKDVLFENGLENKVNSSVHFDGADSLLILAELLAKNNYPIEALEITRQLIDIQNELVYYLFATRDERTILAYYQQYTTTLDYFLSQVYTHFRNAPESVGKALNFVLERKGIITNIQATQNLILHSGNYSHLTEKYQQLQHLNEELFNLTFAPPLFKPGMTEGEYNQQKQEYINRLSELEKQRDYLQSDLACEIPDLKLANKNIEHSSVALKLPHNSALIEFICYTPYSLEKNQGQKPRYLAFILPFQGAETVIKMIDLGETEAIDKLIIKSLEVLAKNKSNHNMAVTKKKSSSSKTETDKQQEDELALLKLSQLIYQPLLPYLSTYQQLFIAPDGELNLLPFAILPLDNTQQECLIDKYYITYLSVGRDLLRSPFPSQLKIGKPLIMGDPDFDYGHNPNLQQKSQQYTTVKTFTPLPETAELVKEIASRYGVEPYLQQNALESYLKQNTCPSLLVIASHGYFIKLEEQERDLLLTLLTCPLGEEEQARSNIMFLTEGFLKILEAQATQLKQEGKHEKAQKLEALVNKAPELTASTLNNQDSFNRLSFTRAENPLMRSGLALAGANTWASGYNLPAGAGKGLLSGLDISSLNLWGNELTILIACSTGVGDVFQGLGVFGLRTAFNLAGAKQVIMSLWDVPTKATMLLMKYFLEHWKPGEKVAPVLQQAQNYIRHIKLEDLQQIPLGRDILEELEQKKCPITEKPLEHPYFWAAWICQGK